MAGNDTLNGVDKSKPSEDNRKVTLRLRPVLPVMMEFYCNCTSPPTLLGSPDTMLPSSPPKYRHVCSECGEIFNLEHASGSVVFQKLDKPDDVPKLVIASQMPGV